MKLEIFLKKGIVMSRTFGVVEISSCVFEKFIHKNFVCFNAMAWFYLICAGLLEVVWSYFMKKSEGFTVLMPSIITVLVMILSFVLLSLSLKQIPLGVGYAIWTGIGIVGALIVGITFLGESASMLRIIAAVLILSGLVLMKIS